MKKDEQSEEEIGGCEVRGAAPVCVILGWQYGWEKMDAVGGEQGFPKLYTFPVSKLSSVSSLSTSSLYKFRHTLVIFTISLPFNPTEEEILIAYASWTPPPVTFSEDPSALETYHYHFVFPNQGIKGFNVWECVKLVCCPQLRIVISCLLA